LIDQPNGIPRTRLRTDFASISTQFIERTFDKIGAVPGVQGATERDRDRA
jgi:hypothetical protein